MYRNELLSLLKERISEHDYLALVVWTKKREKLFGLIRKKFDIESIALPKGYCVSCGTDFILVK